jgi:hypothetical protein
MNPNRRELLRIGAVSVMAPVFLGPQSLRGESADIANPRGNGARCIFIMLQGGPSHIDLWDPKPEAPNEVRGPFSPIDTVVPGIQFSELMQSTARVAHHLAVIRSMTHRFTNHIAGTYVMQTADENQPDADREAHPNDFPGPGAVLNYLNQRDPVAASSTGSAAPVSVSLPNWLSIPGPSNRMPGQYGGFLGTAHDPFLIEGEPHKLDFRPLQLSPPPEVPGSRLKSRVDLRRQLDAHVGAVEAAVARGPDRYFDAALKLLVDPAFRDALDLSREPAVVRDRYGRTKFGQSLLLCRRLIEAGVRFVSHNEFNQAWDHHHNVRDTLRDRVPRMEQSYAALIADLEERGLLPSTLVVNTGEFGRTPVINPDAGRDHWPFVFTTVLAGGGIRGGQVYGSSDSRGAYVGSKAVSPADLLATIWTQMGIDPRSEIRDRVDRPHLLCSGRVLDELL